MSALGGAENGDGPGGIFMLDCESFDLRGAWEVDRGPQHFSYDFWWHLGYDTLISSEWGTPNMFENGVVPEKLLGRRVRPPAPRLGPAERRHRQALDLGDEHQMALELRPAHDPRKTYGFVGVVVSRGGPVGLDLALAPRRDGTCGDPRRSSRSPPSRPTRKCCRRCCKDFGAVPPLVTDINLSLDDRWLYVSCWGTGELRQYDVSDPFDAEADRLGRTRRHRRKRAAHPALGRRSTAGRRWSR